MERPGAAAYRDGVTATTAPIEPLQSAGVAAAPRRRGWFTRLLLGPVDPAAWRVTAHIVLSPYVGILACSLLLPLQVVGVALAPVLLIGVPFLLVVLFLGRQLAHFERARVRAFLRQPLADPDRPPPKPGFLGGVRRDVTDGTTWRALGYLLLELPLGLLANALVLPLWAWGLAMAPLPFYSWALPDGDILQTGGWWTVLWCVSGIAALLLAPRQARGCGAIFGALANGLLARSRTVELESRVQTLADTRSGVVDAADAERRRIERDLHDGAQQRLVALAMNLGRARSRLTADPDGAAALVAEAHEDAKQALAELRDLARGIHPAVLTDRGLDAALSALAARSPVPVRVDVSLDRRLPPSIEAVAYFVVSEALVNVAKHSGATGAEVRVRTAADRVVVTVSDDGHGGADEQPGGGLAGLRGRVAAVDGRLSVSSPLGGPTTVSVELPCAQ